MLTEWKDLQGLVLPTGDMLPHPLRRAKISKDEKNIIRLTLVIATPNLAKTKNRCNI
jgi:hypothetical protein